MRYSITQQLINIEKPSKIINIKSQLDKIVNEPTLAY